ncbi:MAG: chemotaxis protein CheB [Desulfuromonadaceae bacterium]|nr:chemotaxis protein CheB [Desulfuromonadaceae bacterium]
MRKNRVRRFKAVVIGVSSGGVSALKLLLGALPVDFPVPIMVVTHITPDSDDGLAVLLDTYCAIRVKEADEQETATAGTVYLAPANYHLLVERSGNLSFSIDPPVNFARPSVDVLFESAAEAYRTELIGVILTGAGSDGSRGLLKISNFGGLTIVQDPEDAEMDSMPRSALQLLKADHVVRLNEISHLLTRLVSGKP